MKESQERVQHSDITALKQHYKQQEDKVIIYFWHIEILRLKGRI